VARRDFIASLLQLTVRGDDHLVEVVTLNDFAASLLPIIEINANAVLKQ
ncbi:MAG: hypothetical protein I4N51_02620, partial [Acinetobacter sp.]|nr:hypothetical protein [Acinetobacter sp.]